MLLTKYILKIGAIVHPLYKWCRAVLYSLFSFASIGIYDCLLLQNFYNNFSGTKLLSLASNGSTQQHFNFSVDDRLEEVNS